MANADASATPVTVWGFPGGVGIFPGCGRPPEASQSPVTGLLLLESGGAAISRGMLAVRCVFRTA